MTRPVGGRSDGGAVVSDEAMTRIRALLAKGRAGETRYRPCRRIPERSLAAREARYGVTLPEEYRRFLRLVGNGGWMPGAYCDFVLRPIAEARGWPTAATPFPVTLGRLQDRMHQRAAEGWPAEGVLFPELEAYWQQFEQPSGCLVFGQYPSGDALLLVTAGDLRGSVWCAVCGGVPELTRAGQPLGFLAWLADTLDELLRDESTPDIRGELFPGDGADRAGR